jgi:membrane-associated protease RseP (regulator of RpoE activity)
MKPTKTPSYERTFVVAVPVERAWQAFADVKEREAWASGRDHMDDPESLETFEPGEIKIGPSELHERLSWSQYHSGLDGWFENVVTFEEVKSGTRITIVRSGFGDSEAWRHYAESTNGGWDEMIADLVLYLETGVRAARHFSFRSGLAATTRQTAAGLQITHVVPGGFAAEAGMQSGDLLLWLNGAPVISQREVAFCVREHAPGTAIEVEYVRDGEVLRGRAPFSAWNYGTGRYVGHPGGYPKPSLTGD